MKSKTRIITLITFIILLFSSINVYAAGNYIYDDAKVLGANTISEANSNLAKVEENTHAVVKIYLVNSLDGKDINEEVLSKAKELNTERYAVFLVAVKDRKNKFIVGSELRSAFSDEELNRIAAIPNQYFKNGDFSTGVLKVGEAIDKDITTNTIVDNNDNTSIQQNASQPEDGSDFALIIVIALMILAGIIGIIIYTIVYVNKNSKNSSNLNNKSTYGNQRSSGSNQTRNSIRYNHRTINNYNNDRFFEGMMVDEMMHSVENHEENPSHHYHDTNQETNNSFDTSSNDNNTTSGDWSYSSDTTSWDNSSTSSGFDFSSNDTGSSNW
ncbi:MAG: TPM domain-containing protein [Bacillota bacterium]|nr:TPM domain-containing protein [Bacillota bacterium]